MMQGSWPKVGATLPNRQAIFVAHQTIYRLTGVCRTGNLTSANGDEPMAILKISGGLVTAAASQAVVAYIHRMSISMKMEFVMSPKDYNGAIKSAKEAAEEAREQVGADVLSVYDAAFLEATEYLAARFDPTAEEMLAYERSTGQ
jgi:hypothetical protein